MIIGLIITLTGLGMIVSRGPLIFAPEAWRARILTLFDTDRKMRTLGLGMAVLAGLCLFLSMGDSSLPAVWVRDTAAIILVLILVWVIFPGWARRLATNVWTSIGPNTLRVLGALAVLIGLWLVYVGGTMVGAALATH